MSGFILRIIAMTTMLIDHIGWSFLDNPMLLTWIGRISFPVYGFLVAESYMFLRKDNKRLLKYFVLLLILALVSEFCYDLMHYGLNYRSYLKSQNIIFTLILGFIGIYYTDKLLPMNKKIKVSRVFIIIFTYIFLGFTNYYIKGNYNIAGPLLIISFYWYLRYSKTKTYDNKWNWFKRFIVLLIIFIVYLLFYFWVRCEFASTSIWLKTMKEYLPWIFGHLLAVIILSFSNGKLGYHEKWFKNLYRGFYPVHQLIIGIINILV